MATTAQWVFEKAMHLMDEVNESSGKADTADTKEYKNRTLAILNVLRMECFLASDTYRYSGAEKRPVCPEILDFEAPIELDDGVCQAILPYGLAAHLFLEENPDIASFFNQRYQELLSEMAHSVPSVFEPIDVPYGGIEMGQFGRW